ncbi:TPR domain-containing protein [Caballeronia catudaia]|uniref:protein O-GlcNAc transferase n=1 Tax=Caballeronia catudaia TaxID=1777136 RepID=A0A157Z6V7_9BURK|nr:tetratricopeptide repeat protein [Caballeronia catudaia]SAK41059.1 TPR domain-containing protein [Caballeronia catudaia]
MNSHLSIAEAIAPAFQSEHDIVVALKTALQHQQNGEYGDAERLYHGILQAMPGQPDANFHLGTLYVQTGSPSKALPHFEASIGAIPQNGQYWFAYVSALIEDKQVPAAWIAFEIGQKHGLEGPLADLLVRRMTGSAEVTFVPVAAPPSAPIPDNKTRKVGVAGIRRLTAHEINRFSAVFNKGQFADAAKLARTMTQRYPMDGISWRCLGVALNRDGRHAESVAPLKRSIELIPDEIQTRVLLADTLVVLGQFVEAEGECKSIIETAQDCAEAHRIMGIALGGQGRFHEAVASCRRAIELAPSASGTYGTLGMLMLDAGMMTEAAKYLRDAIEVNPNDFASHSNLLFCLVHQTNIDQKTLLTEHRNFGLRSEGSVARVQPKANVDRSPGRRLRVGFVSGDLFTHAVASYVVPVLKSLADDPSLQIFIYHNHIADDATTERIRGYCSHWRQVARMSDEQLARTIQADDIDILVDLSGHTGRNRLLTFARKPAPIQTSWIGYPATTGLSTIDYYLADRFCAPVEIVADQFTEKLVHLPAIGPFIPTENSPPVNLLPAMHNGYVTFGSFNRINKLRPDVIALWARVMHEVPNSKMVIGAMPRGGGQSAEANVTEWFAGAGISQDRLVFRQRSSTAVYLQQHHQVDLCLDAFPYSASTTTLNALWMGVPTVTMAGDSLVSRAATGWISHVGLDRFVARDSDDFVRLAASNATDLPALNEVRQSLRDRCSQSAVFQSDVVAKGVSRAFRIMWERWCNGLPAAHIDAAGV